LKDFHSRRFVILGVGLIGGSVAAALRRAGRVKQIVGVGRSRANMERALALGVVDLVAQDAAEAVLGADVVLLSVPVQQNARVLAQIAASLPPDCLLTDAGSTKRDVVANLREFLPDRLAQCVPAHPIAGAELNGVDAANAGLFVGKNAVVTPLPENRLDAVERTEALWTACGAVVTRMAPEHHDRIFSAVSHLPHVLAFALVNAMSQREDAAELFRFAAGGFRDFTRIAGSSPEMWRDIALANRDALLADIEAYREQLAQLAGMIADADGSAIEAVFSRARQAREQWLRGTKS
jgi:prephenate dehydrogenase